MPRPSRAPTAPPSSNPQAVKRRATAEANGSKLGRPAGTGSFTAAHCESIFERLAEGETLNQICKTDGMPSLGLVLGWAVDQRNPPIADFGDRFARAMHAGWQAMSYQLIDIADEAKGEDMAYVAAVKLKVDTIKWILARRIPSEFGDRLQIDGAGSRAEIHVYLPAKAGAAPGDGARVVNGTTEAIEHEPSDE
jgi:hypothetical protein